MGQILQVTEKTFDPQKLARGPHHPINLRLRFGWWVQRHFGSGMRVQYGDINRFDPTTMTAPLVQAFIPARFIETFLVVADACTRQDPLANGAVPTNRIKKLWPMVGGAAWNQHHYQIVRDKLNHMGVIHITDRYHTRGRAWRWEAGAEFPLGSFKEADREFKKLHRLPAALTPSFEEIIAGSTYPENSVLHNTLYQEVERELLPEEILPRVRPPP